MDSLKFAKIIGEVILSKKGFDIKILDLRNVSSIADYFVVCSADVDRQVKAIADEIDKVLTEQGIKCFHKEGFETLNWVLLDYFDVVVHVFRAESRAYYNLEKFWGDAPVISVEEKIVKKRAPRSKS